MIAYLRANWKQLAGVAVAAAALGWFAHRPAQPAVHLLEHQHYEDDLAELVQVHKVEGPERVVERWKVTPGPGCSSPAEEHERVTERGPVVTDSATARAEHQVTDAKLDLTVTPAPRPGWQLQVGLEDVLGPRTLRLAARRRIFGPFWAEAAVQPATRALGVGLAVEW